MVSSSFCLASVRENNWKTCVGKLPCFPYFVLTRIIKGGGKVFILCLGYFFFTLPRFFPMVSALDYSLLKHVVINDDL